MGATKRISQKFETVIAGKLAVTNSDFSIYIGGLSVVIVYQYLAIVKRFQGDEPAARLSDCGQLLTRTTGFASRPVQPFVMSISEELDIVNE